MSKCVNCGHEILTGDIHWEMGLCNNCYNELYKDHKTHISLDKMWLKLAQDFRDENEKLQDKIADLQKQLEEKYADIIALDTDNYSFKQQIDNLRQQLKNQPAEIVEKIRKQIFNHFNVNNMEEYESLSLLDSLFTADAVTDMLDDILKEYQK